MQDVHMMQEVQLDHRVEFNNPHNEENINFDFLGFIAVIQPFSPLRISLNNPQFTGMQAFAWFDCFENVFVGGQTCIQILQVRESRHLLRLLTASEICLHTGPEHSALLSQRVEAGEHHARLQLAQDTAEQVAKGPPCHHTLPGYTLFFHSCGLTMK